MIKQYTLTKVVSRNFIMDFLASFQNLVGANLTSYEKMIAKGMKQIKDEMKKNKINLVWFRYEVTQLTNGAVSITIYGEMKND